MRTGGKKFSKPYRRLLGKGVWLLATVFITVVTASVASAEWRPRVVRKGTLSLGLYGQGATILGGGELGSDFGFGPGLGARLRYRTSRESALSFNFAAQTYKANDGTFTADSIAVDNLTAITTTVEYVQYFRVRKRAPRYVLIGAGLLQTRRNLANDLTEFPGDGGVLTVGAGTEIWWKRTFSFDLALRYNAYIKSKEFEDGTDVTSTLEISLGFQFYTSR